ncbi:hypothetical protein HY230_10375 [Candidatus Acetothermia bacterium]|nr:hypothetical protein [Candidatus Acetothermia bacterium]
MKKYKQPSKYGANDQIGMLNEITPSKFIKAAKLVKEGKVYDLGRVLVEYWIETFQPSLDVASSRRWSAVLIS